MNYKVGDKIVILYMEGAEEYTNRTGTITSIDPEVGELHGTWGDVAVVPDVDSISIIKGKR